jgi:hypothetical protein
MMFIQLALALPKSERSNRSSGFDKKWLSLNPLNPAGRFCGFEVELAATLSLLPFSRSFMEFMLKSGVFGE